MTILGSAILWVAAGLTTQGDKDAGTTPTLDECLAWLQKLPTMTGMVNKGLDPDRFKKLTADGLKTLKEIQIGGHVAGQKGHVNLPESEYRFLTALPALEIAKFPENDLGDAALVHIGKIKTLKDLRLIECKMTGAGLKHLTGLEQLTQLDLSFCNDIDDAGLMHLAKLSGLKQLTLKGKKLKVTAAGIAELQKALPGCTIVRS